MLCMLQQRLKNPQPSSTNGRQQGVSEHDRDFQTWFRPGVRSITIANRISKTKYAKSFQISPHVRHVADVVVLTGRWVVLTPEINVLLDSEAKAARVGEVFALKLVLLHLKPSLKDLQRLFSADLRCDIESANKHSVIYTGTSYGVNISTNEARGGGRFRQSEARQRPNAANANNGRGHGGKSSRGAFSTSY